MNVRYVLQRMTSFLAASVKKTQAASWLYSAVVLGLGPLRNTNVCCWQRCEHTVTPRTFHCDGRRASAQPTRSHLASFARFPFPRFHVCLKGSMKSQPTLKDTFTCVLKTTLFYITVFELEWLRSLFCFMCRLWCCVSLILQLSFERSISY